VRAVAVLLHGGRAHGTAPVTARQLAVLRMLPFATALQRAGAADGLAVARLRFGVRGWNGTQRSPVADARWALDDLQQRYPGAPVALVGHSMGGRTAVYAADHENVRAVVGLAPWIEPGDPYLPLAARRVLFVHGTHDRMTSARGSAEFARQASTVAASMSYVQIRNDGHPMLRRPGIWHELTAGFVTGVLLGTAPQGTAGSDTTNVLVQALAGQASLVV
jgi:predicted alpha/beta-hydrolase family hydrolase